MLKMAFVAARSGEHEAAIALLHGMQEQLDALPPISTARGRQLALLWARRRAEGGTAGGADEAQIDSHAEEKAAEALAMLAELPEAAAPPSTPTGTGTGTGTATGTAPPGTAPGTAPGTTPGTAPALEAAAAMRARHGTRGLLDLVPAQERWRLRVAARLLAEGCAWPWPPTLVRLCALTTTRAASGAAPAGELALVDGFVFLCASARPFDALSLTFLDLPLTFLDLPLPFHDLLLTFHDFPRTPPDLPARSLTFHELPLTSHHRPSPSITVHHLPSPSMMYPAASGALASSAKTTEDARVAYAAR